ncbi:hypothetical protein BDN71DRAFT_1508550 [Pleurotus eryngii]|uniref:DUF6589 domain-containing protein n=1 Tax=Pleurotus eryngii TaxID=5323 RepID=A0A9P5ZTF1_PLEER|nr:hypothetical protein BDN71DRAFT_1508550 [Pleurotus eryngii]
MNKHCNAITAIIGMLCHATSVPELVIELLSHIGISTSTTAIHDMVSSLSSKSYRELRLLAKTLLAALVYDNFDMDFKSSQPTVGKLEVTLKHATSVLALSLLHVVADDLKCSAELWASDPMNPYIPDSVKRPTRMWVDCIAPIEDIAPWLLSPPGPLPSSTPLPNTSAYNAPPCPSRFIQTIAWHFQYMLVTFVTPLQHFTLQLGKPKTVLQIPVMKTTHIPCRTMDINQSTNDAQAQIIDNLLAQASIGDPTDYPHVTDLREHVLLVHGDLGTGERLFAVKQSRSIEDKEMCRLQPVIFVMGLFHLLMACAEAIWRMYIEPKEVCTDREPNSMYNHACGVRPGDSGHIGSKPSFQMMHEIIHQSAYARMLDCWQVKVKTCLQLTTLEAFAESKLTWDQIVELSLVLAQTYVDHEHTDNQEFRNNSLILGRLIQYVKLAHAMKHGDIGRVKATFLHWVFVFKSVGKHKYVTHLVKVMNDLRYVYPERLKYIIGHKRVIELTLGVHRRAIRLNWLCNPTGTVDSF